MQAGTREVWTSSHGRATRYHVATANGAAACRPQVETWQNRSVIILVESSLIDVADVPSHMKCQRDGCRQLFAASSGVVHDIAVPEKKGPGRPPRAGKKLSTGRVELRLTEQEQARWQREAERRGVALSALIRDAVELLIDEGQRQVKFNRRR